MKRVRQNEQIKMKTFRVRSKRLVWIIANNSVAVLFICARGPTNLNKMQIRPRRVMVFNRKYRKSKARETCWQSRSKNRSGRENHGWTCQKQKNKRRVLKTVLGRYCAHCVRKRKKNALLNTVEKINSYVVNKKKSDV